MTRFTSYLTKIANTQAGTPWEPGEMPMLDNTFDKLTAHDFSRILVWLKKLALMGKGNSDHDQDDDQSDNGDDETTHKIGVINSEPAQDDGLTVTQDDAPGDPSENPTLPTTGEEYAPDAWVIDGMPPFGPGSDGPVDSDETVAEQEKVTQESAIPEQTPTTGQEYLGTASVYEKVPALEEISAGDGDNDAHDADNSHLSDVENVDAAENAIQGVLPLIIVDTDDFSFHEDTDDEVEFLDCLM